MLFTDALDKYQQLLERPHTYRQRTGQLLMTLAGFKMTAREVMDIDEARENMLAGLLSLTDRQIDDQLFKPTPSVS